MLARPCASKSYSLAHSSPLWASVPVAFASTTTVAAPSHRGASPVSPSSEPMPRAERVKRDIVPIYLDNQATTPMDPRVAEVMVRAMTNRFGNPHSKTHQFGRDAEDEVEDARKSVAKIIGADSREIFFTSGSTECNNLAIKGVGRFYAKQTNPKNHIITLVTEHKCVLASARELSFEGIDVTYLPVQSNGLVDLNVLAEAIRPTTSLVSVMAVNNEIGVIQPLKDIGTLCRSKGVFFHTDAAQAVGKIPIDVVDMKIDLLSLTGHKIYGPMGVGALYVSRRPRVRLAPLLSGGGQERGIRSGTLPGPLVVGLGRACQIAMEDMEADGRHVRALSKRLLEGLRKIPEIVVNGDLESRYMGNLNVSFSCVEGESLVMALQNVALSSGSACTSASLEPSYVLRALGVEEDMAHTSIRFGVGRFTTVEEIDYTIALVAKSVDRLRGMSVLWDMKKEGVDLKAIHWSD